MNEVRADGRVVVDLGGDGDLGGIIRGVRVPARVGRAVELARQGVSVGEPQVTADSDAGIRCPDCACAHFTVWRTRPMPRGIRRERICRNCGRKVITTEKMAGK